MNLSNKKIKYIQRNIQDHTLEEISANIGVPIEDIMEYIDNDPELKQKSRSKNTQTDTIELKNIDLGQKLYILFLGILLMTASWVCKGAEWFDFANLAQSIYLQEISVLFLVVFFVRGLIKQDLKIKWTWFYVPVFGFVIWAGLSLTWATNAYEGFSVYLNWLAGSLIFFVLFNSIKDSLDLKIIFTCLIISFTWLVIVGYQQYFNSSFKMYPQVIAPAATFGNKNMMVDVLMSVAPLAIYLILIKNKSLIALNVIGVLLFVFTVCLIIFSLTRSGMLGLSVQPLLYAGILLVIFFAKKESAILNKKLFIMIGATTLVFPIIFFSAFNIKNSYVRSEKLDQEVKFTDFTNRYFSIFVKNEADKWAFKTGTKDEDLEGPISDSAMMRRIVWRNTFAMFLDAPLTGVGVFNWQIHYADFRRAVYNDPVYRPGTQMIRVHNDYLQLLVDLGLPGAIFCFILLVLNIWAIFRCLFRGNDDDLKLAIIIGLCLFGLHSVAMFSFPFAKAIPSMLFFVYCSFLAHFFQVYSPQNTQKEFKLNNAWILSLSVGSIALLFFAFPRLSNMGKADIQFKTSYDQNSLNNHESSITAAKKALELDPYRNKIHFLLGYNYLSLQDFKNAAIEITKGLQYYPNDLNSLLQLGTSYTQLIAQEFEKSKTETQEIKDLIAKAEKWFNKALKIRTDFHTIYNNLGYIYYLRAQYSKTTNPKLSKEYHDIAYQKFTRSIELNPNYVDGLLNCANLLMQNNQRKEAVAHAETAAKLLLSDFEKTENDFIKIRSAVQPNSRRYLTSLNARLLARQSFLNNVGKAISFLRDYYINYERDRDKY